MNKIFGFFLTLFILSVGSALAQDQKFKTTEVTKDVYAFSAPGNMYNAMFVVTTEGVVVADSINPGFASEMMKAIKKVTDKPVKYLVYSHDHHDHIAGGKIFKAAGATVISHEKAKDALLKHPHPDVVVPDFTWFGNKYTLTLGDKTVKLLYFGANHGKGMTVYYLPNEKLAYFVDIVTPKRLPFTIIPDFDTDAWMTSLKEIEKIDFKTAVFSHEGPVGTKKDVVAQREYLEDLKAEIIRKMEAGESIPEIPFTIQLPKYKDWLFYKEWLPMNTWRVMLGVLMGY